MRAHGGVDAVGADQDVGFGGLDGLAVAIDEARRDLAALLLEARDAAAELDLVRAQHLCGGANRIICSSPRWIENCGHGRPAWRPRGSAQIVWPWRLA